MCHERSATVALAPPPIPRPRVAAEPGDRVEFVLDRGRRQRQTGVLTRTGRQPPHVLLDDGAIDLGETVDLRVIFAEPVDEPAQSLPGVVDCLRAIELGVEPQL